MHHRQLDCLITTARSVCHWTLAGSWSSSRELHIMHRSELHGILPSGGAVGVSQHAVGMRQASSELHYRSVCLCIVQLMM